MTAKQGRKGGVLARLRRWLGRPALPDLPPVEDIAEVPAPPRPLTSDPDEIRDVSARVRWLQLQVDIRNREPSRHTGPGHCIPKGGG